MPVPRNVLIFHQGALGDFIVTWPVALALGRLFPQSRVMYVTAAGKGQLAERMLRIESIDAEHSWHELFAEHPTLDDLADRALKGAHLVLNFANSESEHWNQNVAALASEAQILSLRTKVAEGKPQPDQHVAEFIVEQLAAYSPALQSAAAQMLKLINSRGVGATAAKENGPVVIHPGAGAPRKCWPAERFLALARILSKSGKSVKFVVGEVERENWPVDRMESLHRVAQIVQPTNYLELCDLIVSASAFVGNDSGPAHLAGICGLPTITLFGSDPARWHPIGPKVRIVRGESIEAISVDDVIGILG